MRRWFQPRRPILVVFIFVAVVSAAALGWLMWLLLEQDKTVEIQRRQERLEQAADRAAAVMQAALADLEHTVEPPGGVFSVRIDRDEIHVRPQGLLYYPLVASHPQKEASQFRDGEQAEFVRHDLNAALDIYDGLAQDHEASIRAGALTRLARVRRKMKDPEGAIHAYDELSKIPSTFVAGLPAALVAREGRANVFEEVHRSRDLHKEAAALDEDLRNGHWQITKAQYEFYAAEAVNWLSKPDNHANPDAIARAEAVTWLWENRFTLEPSTRRLIQTGGYPALITSHATADGVSAMIAGPKYLASLCHEAVPDAALLCTLTDAEGHPAIGNIPTARTAAATRTAAAARLPWTLQISSADSSAIGATPQRRLLSWVAAVLSFVWLTGTAFIVRAIRREARVAQLQSDFVAAVSHEFRTPLSSLSQISEMLAANRFASDEMRHNAYAVLTRESERLQRLVKGLLDFQRLEAGADVYHFEPLAVGPFWESIVGEFRDTVKGSGYTIELRSLENTVYVKADREALSRAIWNLLDNAVKYSPEYRTVWVDVERQGDRVSVVVRDRGLGIPLHEQRDIFDKFVRGADSKARRIKGTGIGLAMVRRIVQAHGGEILLVSAPGEGSRFTITIPAGASS